MLKNPTNKVRIIRDIQKRILENSDISDENVAYEIARDWVCNT